MNIKNIILLLVTLVTIGCTQVNNSSLPSASFRYEDGSKPRYYYDGAVVDRCIALKDDMFRCKHYLQQFPEVPKDNNIISYQ
jgi:hypothetical protein